MNDMAKSVVSFVLEQLGQFLLKQAFRLVVEERALVKGVESELNEIKDELECIHAFLEDANTRYGDDGGGGGSNGVKTWVKQLREVSFRIQDVINYYTMYEAERVNQPRLKSTVQMIPGLIKTMNPRHQIASEIQDIKLSLGKIKERSTRFEFRSESGLGSYRGPKAPRIGDPRLDLYFNVKLESKKYFIILDDIWESNFFDEIVQGLVNNKRGSRIIFTTCKMQVPVDLPLPPNKEQELFCNKAFKGERPTKLEWEKDLLIDISNQGIFVSQKEHDILVEAIKTNEHGGRAPSVDKIKELQKKEMDDLVDKKLAHEREVQKKELEDKLAQYRKSQKKELEEMYGKKLEDKLAREREVRKKEWEEHYAKLTPVGVTVQPMGVTVEPITNEVDELPERVGLGGASTKRSCSVSHTHTQNEMIVPSNDSIIKLVCYIMDLKELIPLQLEHDRELDVFYIDPKDIRDFIFGNEWLDVGILQLWCTYMHRVCIESNKSNIYGFLDPFSIRFTDNSPKVIESFISSRLKEENKDCYLAPFIDSGHWQLIIISLRTNMVIMLCSMAKPLELKMKCLLTTVVERHNMLNGVRNKRLTFCTPLTRKQKGGYECGLYVMKHMLNIVSAGMVDSWDQMFNETKPFSIEDFKDIRTRWTSCFNSLYRP